MTEISSPSDKQPATSDDTEVLDAFICYSREDIELCRQLEKALENFKPPKGLPGSGRRLRIFRDEDDFVGPEYYRAIEGFLARSRKLIVVSSPAARRSEYTNDEIRRFVALHGPEHLVVVLAGGIPNNEVTPGEEEKAAFPDALCEAAEMPLAISWADFDPASDRVDRGRFGGSWYTLLAGLLDVDRGVVEQRDLKRSRRRRRLFGSVTAGVILALSGLSAWALTEQAAARIAEAAAEDSAIVAQAQRDTAQTQRLLAIASEQAAADSAAVAQAQRAEAQTQRNVAEAQRAQAWTRLLAAQAADFAARDAALTPRAMLLAIEALRIGPDEVASGVLRAGLSTASRLRMAAPWGRDFTSAGDGPCLKVPGGVEVQRTPTERVARVVRSDGRVELVLHDGPITHCAFLSDGSVATASGTVEMGAGEPLPGDGTVRVWDPPPPLLTLSPEGPGESRLVATAFSPTDPIAAVAFDNGGAVEILDLNDGRRVAELEVGEGQTVSDLTFSQDGRFLASAQIYGQTFDVWAVDGFDKVGSFGGSWGEGSVELSPAGDLLVGFRGNLVGRGRGLVWNVADGRPMAFPQGGDTLLWHPSLTPDGRHLVTIDPDAQLVLWDLDTQSPLDTIPDVLSAIPGHGSLWLFTGTPLRSTLSRWSMVPGDPPVRVQEVSAGCLAFGPGRVAIRCADGGLELFDSSSGRAVRRLSESADMTQVSFSSDGRWIAAASYAYGGLAHTGLRAGSSLKVWDATSGALVGSFGQQGLVAKVGFSPDGRFLGSSVYLSEESGFAPAALWVWQSQDLIEQACRSLTRNLTREEWETYVPGDTEYRATCQNLPPDGMPSAWGRIVQVDRASHRATISDDDWYPLPGYCEEPLRTSSTTRVLIADPAGGWRAADIAELAEDDQVRIYVPRIGSGECPAEGVPIAVVARGWSTQGDAADLPAALRTALEELDSLEAQEDDFRGVAVDQEPWERIARAGICEWEASFDGSRNGVRTLYCSLARAGFIDWLIEDAPAPMFRSGPHDGSRFNLDSSDFGHYDPVFIEWAATRLLSGLGRPLVRPVAQLAYRPWAHLGTVYYWALNYLDEHPALDRELQAMVAGGQTDLGDALADFEDAAFSAGLPGQWANELAMVAAGFWVRRGIDGSRDAFRAALTDLLRALDPAVLEARQEAGSPVR